MSLIQMKSTALNSGKVFFMLFIILMTGRANPLLGFKVAENPILMPVYLLILIFFFAKYCKRPPSLKFSVVLVAFFVWYIATCIKWGGVQPIYMVMIYNGIMAYIAIHMYRGREFFYYFEKVLVFLGAISLVVWTSNILFPAFTVAFMKAISLLPGPNDTGTMLTNSFIVGLGQQKTDFGIIRNIGFTWEAGRFSCYLSLGMFFNLVLRNFKFPTLKSNRSFYILFFCLLSTISTTGYMIFLWVAMAYIFNKSQMSRVAMFFLFALVLPFIMGISFMGDKIVDLMNVEQEISRMQWTFANTSVSAITPQRFTGLYLDWLNWKNDFWLGYNVNEQTFANRVLFKGKSVWVSEGVLQIFAMYGLFIGFLFYYLLLKSSTYWSNFFRYKGVFLFIVLFLLMNISYDFWANNISLYLLFYPLFYKLKIGSPVQPKYLSK